MEPISLRFYGENCEGGAPLMQGLLSSRDDTGRITMKGDLLSCEAASHAQRYRKMSFYQ